MQQKLAEQKKAVYEEAAAIAPEIKSKKRAFRDAPNIAGSLGFSLSQSQDDTA